MTIANKIAETAEKAAQTIARKTDEITGKIAGKVGRREDAVIRRPRLRTAHDDEPGLIDKLTVASERLGTQLEEITARYDAPSSPPAAIQPPTPPATPTRPTRPKPPTVPNPPTKDEKLYKRFQEAKSGAGATAGPYESRTKAELMKRAAEVGIKGRSKMKKDELIDALRRQ